MRLAFFSPLSPKPSGISDYSEALLPHLAPHFESVDVFVEDTATRFGPLPENLRILYYREFEALHSAGKYDLVLYQMGNNPFHAYMYDIALRVPGAVVLHEFNLHHLIANITVARQDWDGYIQELKFNASSGALERAQQAKLGLVELDYNGVAMNRRLLEKSVGAIVHSSYVESLVRDAGFRLPVKKIQHGVDVRQIDRVGARKKTEVMTGFKLDDSTVLFGSFGFLKPYKRIREVIRAFARLRVCRPEIKLVLVGEEHPHYPLRPLIEELGLCEAVRILGYVSLDAFVETMAACDFCINLRWPTVGETSGSLLRALALGKPTFISDVGAFQEFPEDVAIKIPVNEQEVEWLFEHMKLLLEDPALARSIGEQARSFAQRECQWPKVASEYAAFLEQCRASSKKSSPLITTGSVQESSRNGHRPLSRSELEEYIVSFSHSSPLMEDYVRLHRRRLAHTVEITPMGGERDRILELGCYLQMTPALRKYLGYGEVRGGYYGRAGQTDYRGTTSSEGEVFACPVDLFDVEKDCFPYEDGYFRTVLCCELVEHLPNDPMHMVAEINRILAPGGAFILTTPNISSLRSIEAILYGYHPGVFHAYIKPGPDGAVDPRHSREYTPREVAVLMDSGGFDVELLETGDYGEGTSSKIEVERLLESSRMSKDLRGEIIYGRGRKVSSVRDRWPKDLYYPP